MSIRVIENWMGELEAVVGDKSGRIAIHPWNRSNRSGEPDSRVAVSLGNLKKDGNPKKSEKDWELKIFDRADFVEALLAVFPELQRVSK